MTVDNRYKILREIGRGGTSCVYLAENTRVHNYWAIKEVYKSSITGEGVESKTLIAESSLLTKLRHPGLPSIIDVIDCDQTFLIVMEYIDGISLDKLLENNGAQSQNDVLKWGQQLCDVLEYIHGQQPSIIYRDMKPANVMLKPDGNIVLIDFGMAREFKGYNTHDTTMLGTHGYAAPEQYSGNRQSDARTDIYGLGVTLYHLVTGRDPCQPPYIDSIRSANPALSPQLDQIIQKCTELDPDKRYQNAHELSNALKAVAQGGGQNAINNINNLNSLNNGNNQFVGYKGNNVNAYGGATNYYDNNNFNNVNSTPYGYNMVGDNTGIDTSMEEGEPKKGSKLLWLLAVIPVVIILLLVAVVLGTSDSGDGGAETEPVNTAAPGYYQGETSDQKDGSGKREIIVNEPGKVFGFDVEIDASGYYRIHSVSGSVKPWVQVYSEKTKDGLIKEHNTKGEYDDFDLICYLEAGHKYYVRTSLYELDPVASPTGIYTLYIAYDETNNTR